VFHVSRKLAKISCENWANFSLKTGCFLAADFWQPISKNGPKVTIVFEKNNYFQKN